MNRIAIAALAALGAAAAWQAAAEGVGKRSVPPAEADAARLAAEAPAAERADFDLYFGGLRAGAMFLELEWTGAAYEARSEGRSAGLIGALYEAFFAASASGASSGGLTDRDALAPEEFAADASFGGDGISLEMTWRDGAPAEVRADPPFKPKPHQIEPSAQTGAIDPLAAAALFLSSAPADAVCGREADVFDGRRRSRITLEAPREVRGEILCPGSWSRVAGFKPEDMGKDDIPLKLWFRLGEDGMAHVERAVIDTGYGLATAVRRR